MNPINEMTREELEEEVKSLRIRCQDLENAYKVLSETLEGWFGEQVYRLIKPYIDRLLTEVLSK